MHNLYLFHTRRTFLLLALAIGLGLSACTGDGAPRRAALGDTWQRPTDTMIMVYVPAGTFVMGSDAEETDAALSTCQAYREDCTADLFSDERPAHTVVLEGFWLDQTEVSNAQYQRCVDEGACEPSTCASDTTFNAPEQPVVCVSWLQAEAYCTWAGGRLPTEAEWEYAARGAAGASYPWGEVFDGSRLNYCDATCELEQSDPGSNDGFAQTAPVGKFPAGASWCSALDMAGNAWEWTADWYAPYPAERQSDPTGPETGRQRVTRGGGWDTNPAFLRATTRNWGLSDSSSNVTGFRCVLSTQN